MRQPPADSSTLPRSGSDRAPRARRARPAGQRPRLRGAAQERRRQRRGRQQVPQAQRQRWQRARAVAAGRRGEARGGQQHVRQRGLRHQPQRHDHAACGRVPSVRGRGAGTRLPQAGRAVPPDVRLPAPGAA